MGRYCPQCPAFGSHFLRPNKEEENHVRKRKVDWVRSQDDTEWRSKYKEGWGWNKAKKILKLSLGRQRSVHMPNV
jgi:hypothetical protein